jgi:hypothetical protein
MTIYYMLYEAEPLPKSEDFETCGGAYVNCWVRAESQREAEGKAFTAIEEAGWKILCVEEECCEVTESWYSEDEEGREHYEQAVADGECYVFHQWPLEPQEGVDVH